MTTETAVTVIEQSPEAVVEYNLDNWPTDKFNRLIPTQTIGLVNDLIRPVIQVIQLDVEADTYTSNDIPAGHRAPNAVGLSKLADAAGVDFVDEVRLDDGSDPDRAYVRVYAEKIDATGLKRRAPGSRDYRLSSQKMTDPQRARAKGYVHEHAATRAKHRALRALMSLPQSYPTEALERPFAVVRLVPNMQNPELREAVKAAMAPAIAALYGPSTAKQLAIGQVIDVPEVDDEPVNVTPAPATPTVLPGEKLAAAPASSDEPPWITKAAAPATPKPSFAESIRASALQAEDPEALAGQAELERMATIFAGWEQGLIVAGLKTLWPDTALANLAGGQAKAIDLAHESLGHDKFELAWRDLVAKT